MGDWNDIPYEQLPGAHIERKLEGYSENIKSKTIISFEYNCGDFSVSAKVEDDGIHINSRGGYSTRRDGKYFVLDYIYNSNVMERIQELVEKHNLSRGNGNTVHVNGLPDGLGDYLHVEYDSGETIFMTSNQCRMHSDETIGAIYDLFHTFALENNFDFNSEGSNVLLYDDADVEFLQGTWKGKHFGYEYVVEFKDNHVKIYKDGKLDDDCDYVIYEGNIRTNKLKDGVDEVKSEHDYEEFNTISCMRKKNKILIVAYFMKESYSTCDLIRQEVS